MKWTFGRLLEVLGMGVSLIGLVAACMGAGSMKYELMCLGVGVVIFYCGNTLRVGAEGR